MYQTRKWYKFITQKNTVSGLRTLMKLTYCKKKQIFSAVLYCHGFMLISNIQWRFAEFSHKKYVQNMEIKSSEVDINVKTIITLSNFIDEPLVHIINIRTSKYQLDSWIKWKYESKNFLINYLQITVTVLHLHKAYDTVNHLILLNKL